VSYIGDPEPSIDELFDRVLEVGASPSTTLSSEIVAGYEAVE
jgi:hypothetical protein